MTTRHRIDPVASEAPSAHVDRVLIDDGLEARLAQFEEPPLWAPRAGRPNARAKFAAGLRGLKLAFRGDSSFFAHSYRGLLIALAAALVRVGPLQWCMIALAGALVLIAELAHSAVDTLARAMGDPNDPGPTAAREIATAGVLVAVIVFASVASTVLTLKFLELLGA